MLSEYHSEVQAINDRFAKQLEILEKQTKLAELRKKPLTKPVFSLNTAARALRRQNSAVTEITP